MLRSLDKMGELQKINNALTKDILPIYYYAMGKNIGFNNEQYLEEQTSYILERLP
jgi:hypothetical protein